MSRENAEPRVTDHAVLRYIERELGYDVESIRRRIMTPAIRSAIIAGAKTMRHGGLVYVLADNAVITIMEEQARPRLKGVDRAADATEAFG